MKYTVLITDEDRDDWFWHVAEDIRNGRGWSGEAESAQRAAEQASAKLAQAVAASQS